MLTVEFKDKLDLLLIKNEDDIMEVIFDEPRNEYGERYAEVYKIEWYYYKQEIIEFMWEFHISGIHINPMGLAYIMLSKLMNLETICEEIAVDNLASICEKIIKELEG